MFKGKTPSPTGVPGAEGKFGYQPAPSVGPSAGTAPAAPNVGAPPSRGGGSAKK